MKPVRGVALVAVALLGLHVLALAAAAVLGLGAAVEVGSVRGGAGTGRAFALYDDMLRLLEGLAAAGNVIAVVALAVWMWRVHTNAGVIGDGLRWSRMWTVLGWVVPVANFFVPRRIAVDVWNASASGERPTIINLWWAAWLVYGFGGFVPLGMPEPQTATELHTRLWVELGLIAAGSAAAVLAIMVVWRITRLQEADHARLSQALA